MPGPPTPVADGRAEGLAVNGSNGEVVNVLLGVDVKAVVEAVPSRISSVCALIVWLSGGARN